MTKILGISAFYHDSAAAIIEDGKIVAAAQEERFTRKKHDSSYPFHAIEFVLNYSKTKLSEVNNVVFFEKPFLKFEHLKPMLQWHQEVSCNFQKLCQPG